MEKTGLWEEVERVTDTGSSQVMTITGTGISITMHISGKEELWVTLLSGDS